MDETIGLKLIADLKNDPKKFYDEGKSYELVQEYYKGFPKETLRPLLKSEDKWIKRVAIWTTSELGMKCSDLLDDVVGLVNDDDEYTCCYALETVAAFSGDRYIEEFEKLFLSLEHENETIRRVVMIIISGLFIPRIHEAYIFMTDRKTLNEFHEKGLSALLNVNELIPPEITRLIEDENCIVRKYGIIAARKLCRKYPQIIKEAVNHTDPDVQDYAETVIKNAATSTWFLNQQK